MPKDPKTAPGSNTDPQGSDRPDDGRPAEPPVGVQTEVRAIARQLEERIGAAAQLPPVSTTPPDVGEPPSEPQDRVARTPVRLEPPKPDLGATEQRQPRPKASRTTERDREVRTQPVPTPPITPKHPTPATPSGAEPIPAPPPHVAPSTPSAPPRERNATVRRRGAAFALTTAAGLLVAIGMFLLGQQSERRTRLAGVEPPEAATPVVLAEHATGATPGLPSAALAKSSVAPPEPPPPVETPGDMVRIEPGRFLMGSNVEEEGRFDNEPEIDAEITRPFFLGQHEVTQEAWRDRMGNNPSHFSSCGTGCPVEQVSWWDALTYANARSAHEGLEPCYTLSDCNGNPGTGTYVCNHVAFIGLECTGYRLPTEVEWEYAARATTTGARYEDLHAVAWHATNSLNQTTAVGGMAPNAWGLYDMLGNVWEWTNDTEPTEPGAADTTPSPIVRGGSWADPERKIRAAHRSSAPADTRVDSIGFRLARSAHTLHP